MIVKTQHLVEVARRDNHKPERYYLRGFQPVANTTPTMAPYWWANWLGDYSNDPRLRRCGSS
eukprot:12425528-Karenia_brevis.AAC.1